MLLEPEDEERKAHWLAVKRELEQRVPVLAAQKFADDGSVSDYVFITMGEGQPRIFGKWRGDVPAEFLMG